MIKNLPATQVHSLGWEDPLEKGIATYSSILAWGIPWTEEAGGLQSVGSQRVRHDRANLCLSVWGIPTMSNILHEFPKLAIFIFFALVEMVGDIKISCLTV